MTEVSPTVKVKGLIPSRFNSPNFLVNLPMKTPCIIATIKAVKVKAYPVCLDAQFIALSVHKAKVVSNPAKEKVTIKNIAIKNKSEGILKRLNKSLNESKKFIEINCLFLLFGSINIKYARRKDIVATINAKKNGVL